MLPQMPRTVVVRTPGEPGTDEVTGNPIPGPTVDVATRAYLAQRPVMITSGSEELGATQDTVITTYTLLVPYDVVITSESTVADEDGTVYQVEGHPAPRSGLGRRPNFIAASLRRISDMQS